MRGPGHCSPRPFLEGGFRDRPHWMKRCKPWKFRYRYFLFLFGCQVPRSAIEPVLFVDVIQTVRQSNHAPHCRHITRAKCSPRRALYFFLNEVKRAASHSVFVRVAYQSSQKSRNRQGAGQSRWYRPRRRPVRPTYFSIFESSMQLYVAYH